MPKAIRSELLVSAESACAKEHTCKTCIYQNLQAKVMFHIYKQLDRPKTICLSSFAAKANITLIKIQKTIALILFLFLNKYLFLVLFMFTECLYTGIIWSCLYKSSTNCTYCDFNRWLYSDFATLVSSPCFNLLNFLSADNWILQQNIHGITWLLNLDIVYNLQRRVKQNQT